MKQIIYRAAAAFSATILGWYILDGYTGPLPGILGPLAGFVMFSVYLPGALVSAVFCAPHGCAGAYENLAIAVPSGITWALAVAIYTASRPSKSEVP